MTGWVSSSQPRLIHHNHKASPFILVIYLNPCKLLVKLTDNNDESPTQAGSSATVLSSREKKKEEILEIRLSLILDIEIIIGCPLFPFLYLAFLSCIILLLRTTINPSSDSFLSLQHSTHLRQLPGKHLTSHIPESGRAQISQCFYSFSS